MSWWDTRQFTSIASNAIKNAQKKIDKVLDIPTEEVDDSVNNSTWSSWGSPSLLSASSKPIVETAPASSPQPPVAAMTTPAAEQKEAVLSPLDSPEHNAAASSFDAASSSAAARRERAERRRAARKPSTEKTSTAKKFGAVKLGAVKAAPARLIEQELNSVATSAEDHVDTLAAPENSNLCGTASTDSPETIEVSKGLMEGTPVDKADALTEQVSATIVEVADTLEEVPDTTGQVQDTTVKVQDTTVEMPDTTVELPDTTGMVPDTAVKLSDPTGKASDITGNAAESEVVAMKKASTSGTDTSHNIEDSSNAGKETVRRSDRSSPATVDQPAKSSGDETAGQPDQADIIISQEAPAATHSFVNSSDVSVDLISRSIESDIVLVNPDETDTLVSAGAPGASGVPEEPEERERASTPEEQGSTVEERSEDRQLVRSEFADIELVTPLAGTAEGQVEESPIRTESAATLVNTSTSQLTTLSGSSEGTVVDEVLSPRLTGRDTMSDSTAAMDQSTCSDNSYVKCDLPPSSNMADSASDFQRRAPSEFSLANMTDFETATSSDIEIISMASTYGDGNGEARMMDFVPLSRSVFKTRIRNISPDEDMTGSPLQLSPGSDRDSSGQSEQSSGQSEAKRAENSVNSDMIKKVSQLTEVLEARENKLLSMSREQSELLEVNAHLKRRIEQMEETNGDLNLVKSEFGQRLHDVERKLQNALREKELVKKQYLSAQEELHNRIGTSGKMQKIVEEKDEQISSLLAEGEKLTKQQLASNNLIKKLRKKEKDLDELNRNQSHKIESQNSELERLKAVLDSKIQNEAEHTELIKQLNSAVSSYQAEAGKLKAETEEALEKQRRAESAVDNSYKEIAELHKSLAAKDTDIRELKQGNEAHMKEELQHALDRKQKEALRDADHLTSQIEDMQLSISRMEKEQNRREECLRQEKQDLLDRLEEADKRNDELTQSVTSATKPLLRQIENLQSSYSTQSMSWERVEKSLTERLADMQSRLAASSEKERQASDSALELSSHVSILESQLSSLKQEKSKLMAEVEVSKMKISTLQDERNSAVTQLETYKATMESDTMEVKKAHTLLENKLELEKTRMEAEKKKCAALLEQLNEKEQQIHELSTSRLTSTPSPSFMQDDIKTPTTRRSFKQDELLERALTSSTMAGSSLYDSMRNHSTTSLFESLESQVKQREGEIVQLQADIADHEKTRESLTKEMVKLTEENGRQEVKLRELSRLQQQYKELNARYQALLQMYGEKEEEVNELRLDLIDVKQMYKQQIDALLSK